MDIHRTVTRDLQKRLRQDLTIGHDHEEIRFKPLNLVLKGFFFHALRLKNDEPMLLSSLLDRAREDLLSPSLASVRLCNDCDHLIESLQEALQAGDRKNRGPEKNYSPP